MLNSQRIFVDAVKRYCSDHGIAVDIRTQGWLIVMRRGSKERPNERLKDALHPRL